MLKLIATAQRAGFSLDEIRALLPSGPERWNHAALIGALHGKEADIEAPESRLAQSKAQLVAVIADIEARPDDMDCAANARRVLSRVLGDGTESPSMAADDVKLLGKTERSRSWGKG